MNPIKEQPHLQKWGGLYLGSKNLRRVGKIFKEHFGEFPHLAIETIDDFSFSRGQLETLHLLICDLPKCDCTLLELVEQRTIIEARANTSNIRAFLRSLTEACLDGILNTEEGAKNIKSLAEDYPLFNEEIRSSLKVGFQLHPFWEDLANMQLARVDFAQAPSYKQAQTLLGTLIQARKDGCIHTTKYIKILDQTVAKLPEYSTILYENSFYGLPIEERGLRAYSLFKFKETIYHQSPTPESAKALGQAATEAERLVGDHINTEAYIREFPQKDPALRKALYTGAQLGSRHGGSHERLYAFLVALTDFQETPKNPDKARTLGRALERAPLTKEQRSLRLEELSRKYPSAQFKKPPLRERIGKISIVARKAFSRLCVIFHGKAEPPVGIL
jgi:hypothetical protein